MNEQVAEHVSLILRDGGDGGLLARALALGIPQSHRDLPSTGEDGGRVGGGYERGQPRHPVIGGVEDHPPFLSNPVVAGLQRVRPQRFPQPDRLSAQPCRRGRRNRLSGVGIEAAHGEVEQVRLQPGSLFRTQAASGPVDDFHVATGDTPRTPGGSGRRELIMQPDAEVCQPSDGGLRQAQSHRTRRLQRLYVQLDSARLRHRALVRSRRPPMCARDPQRRLDQLDERVQLRHLRRRHPLLRGRDLLHQRPARHLDVEIERGRISSDEGGIHRGERLAGRRRRLRSGRANRSSG
jgi:hypothetical protein